MPNSNPGNAPNLKDKGMILVLVLVLVGQWIIVTFGGEMFRTTLLHSE